MSFSDVKRGSLASMLPFGTLCAAVAFRPSAVPLAVESGRISEF